MWGTRELGQVIWEMGSPCRIGRLRASGPSLTLSHTLGDDQSNGEMPNNVLVL
jgi:hypothetical protein